MGQPIDPCFKQNNVYKLFNDHNTTTSTPNPNIDSDFFILPLSGIICPSIELNTVNNTWAYPEIPITEKNTFICVSELYETNPCIIELDKYIKIADINIETNRCKRYKLIVKNLQIPNMAIETTNPQYFYILGSNLYINSTVLDFNKPSGNYIVQLELLDYIDNNVIFTTNHTVNVNPCLCLQPTPTT